MSYHRSSSPGTRRLPQPGRLSDTYYTYTAYASPRSSGDRLVPIVTRDVYSGRPRRSTLTDPSHPSITSAPTSAATSTAHLHPRSRPAIIQSSHDRPQSPSSPLNFSSRSPDYYAVPATSIPSSHRDHSHKKVYSIDGGGKSRLVADIDINTNTTHGSSRRRHSVDRNGHRTSHSHHHHKAYHLSGSSARKDDADQGYSYTDPVGMYRDTEPRWRHRQGSVDRPRPRPSSAVMEQYPARSSARELGPPTSRALDRFNDGLGRGPSIREPPRSSNRLSYQEPPYTSDSYLSSVNRHSTALHQDRARDAGARDLERSRPKQRYEDHSVERRGFGIRSGSQDRYAQTMNRGSNESFEAYYSDRDCAPPRSDPRSYDRPKDADRDRDYRARDRDRERARLRDDGYTSERERRHDRETRRDRERRDRDRDRDVTPRDSGDSLANTLLPAALSGLGAVVAAGYGSSDSAKRDRDRDRDYDNRERDRENDRERERDPEREQYERDRNREREHRDRERGHEKRERERERERERDMDFGRDGDKERDRVPEHRARERSRNKDRDRPRRHSSSSDSNQTGSHRPRRSEPVDKDLQSSRENDGRFDSRDPQQDRNHDSDSRRHGPERDRGVSTEPPRVQMDADEEYRRRMEQAQKEIINSSQESGDSDRDRSKSGVETALNRPIAPATAAVIDNHESTVRENRVRIVEPPSDKEELPPIKGILKRPTQQFPEDPNPVREGVAPLKEVCCRDDESRTQLTYAV